MLALAFPVLALLVATRPEPLATGLVVTLFPSEDAAAELASLENEALSASSNFSNVRLLPAARLRSVSGEDFASAIRRCKGEEACILGQLTRFQLGAALLITEDRSLPEVALSIQFLRAGVGTVASGLYTGPGARPDRIREVVEKGGGTPGGRVAFELIPPDASLLIDDTLIREREVVLSEGSHLIQVEAPDYELQRRVLEVRRGVTYQQEVALEHEPGLMASPWFWGSVGAVAVVVGVTVATVLLSKPSGYEYCLGAPCR